MVAKFTQEDLDAELAHVRATAKRYLKEAGLDKETRPEMLSEGGMMEKARKLVWLKFYSQNPQAIEGNFTLDKDVYVVWFSKTLQNWKALISTNVADDMYYEVTYNGDKSETYIDAYHKVKNVVVLDYALGS